MILFDWLRSKHPLILSFLSIVLVTSLIQSILQYQSLRIVWSSSRELNALTNAIQQNREVSSSIPTSTYSPPDFASSLSPTSTSTTTATRSPNSVILPFFSSIRSNSPPTSIQASSITNRGIPTPNATGLATNGGDNDADKRNGEDRDGDSDEVHVHKVDQSFNHMAKLSKQARRHASNQFRIHEQKVLATDACGDALNDWPNEFQQLSTASVTFLAFHLWICVLGFTAVIFKSAPHLIALYVAHWNGLVYAVIQTVQIRDSIIEFHSMVGEACNSMAALKAWESSSIGLEISIAVIELISFVATIFFTLKLTPIFAWSWYTDKGGDVKRSQIQKMILFFYVSIHLSSFFVMAFQTIWLLQLYSVDWIATEMEDSISFQAVYRTLLAILTALEIPSLFLAVHASRIKSKKLISIFLLVQLILMMNGIFICSQRIFQITRANWNFLSFLASVAIIFSATNFILGVLVYRSFNLNQFIVPRRLSCIEEVIHVHGDAGGEEKIGQDQEKLDLTIFYPTEFITSHLEPATAHSKEDSMEIQISSPLPASPIEVLSNLTAFNPDNIEPIRKLKIKSSKLLLSKEVFEEKDKEWNFPASAHSSYQSRVSHISLNDYEISFHERFSLDESN